MFTAPTFGAGGTFPGLATSASAPIDATGVAAAPTLTANYALGTFTVVAAADAVNAVAFQERVIPDSVIPLAKRSNSGVSGLLPPLSIGTSLVSDPGFFASASPATQTTDSLAGGPSGNELANAVAPSNAVYDGATARANGGNTSLADAVFAEPDLFV
jgi:hypothetical protein